MMTGPYDFGGLDFAAEGYFVLPDYMVDLSRESDSYGSVWEFWVAVLERAKQGDFSWAPNLLHVYNRSEDYVLASQCVTLLGDAAPETKVTEIRESVIDKLVPGSKDYTFVFDMSKVLFAQKKLADIPLLLNIYQDCIRFKENEAILIYIESILGGIYLAGGIDALESDSELVSQRYDDLLDKYGTTEVALWRGEPFTVIRLAKASITNIDQVTAPRRFRQTIEAYTGLDCRGFFKKGVFQPLTTTRILEEFLENPAVNDFEEGKRYFFGHRIG